MLVGLYDIQVKYEYPMSLCQVQGYSFTYAQHLTTQVLAKVFFLSATFVLYYKRYCVIVIVNNNIS